MTLIRAAGVTLCLLTGVALGALLTELGGGLRQTPSPNQSGLAPRIVKTLVVERDGSLSPAAPPASYEEPKVAREGYTPVSPPLRDTLLGAQAAADFALETAGSVLTTVSSSQASSPKESMSVTPGKGSAPAASSKQIARILSDSSPDPTLEQTITKLLTGSAVIDSPTKMQVDQTRRVTVRIGRNVPDAEMLFQNRADRQTTMSPVKVTKFMRVTLSSPSFAIKEVSPLRQMIVPGTPTEWEFDLKAIEAGQTTIVAQFWLIIKQGDELEKMLVSREQNISVEVRPRTLDEVMESITKSLNTASGLLTAAASFASLLAGLFINLVWRVLVTAWRFVCVRCVAIMSKLHSE